MQNKKTILFLSIRHSPFALKTALTILGKTKEKMQQCIPMAIASVSCILLVVLGFVTSESTMYIEFVLYVITRSFTFGGNMNYIVVM